MVDGEWEVGSGKWEVSRGVGVSLPEAQKSFAPTPIGSTTELTHHPPMPCSVFLVPWLCHGMILRWLCRQRLLGCAHVPEEGDRPF